MDKAIYSFWVTILNEPGQFCEWIKGVDVTIDNWHKFKEIRENLGEASDFEIAQSTFFLNRTNVSGILTGGVIGGLDQHGKYKIDARFNKDDLVRRIEYISSFRRRINISNSDGLVFIRKMNRKTEPIFIYLDPPYYEKGSKLYLNSYIDKDHRRLSKDVHKLKTPWMVSYDNQEFIMNLYANYSKAVYQFSQCASNRIGDEVLIFSDELIFNSALKRLNSPYMIEPSF